MPYDARTKLSEIKCKHLHFFSAEETKRTDKALSSGQTCLPGDQIQPRHRTAKWILVSPDLAAYAEGLAVGYNRPPPRKAREAQGLGGLGAKGA